MRSTVRPSSCILPSRCARPALIASRSSVTGSGGLLPFPNGQTASWSGGTKRNSSPESRSPPHSSRLTASGPHSPDPSAQAMTRRQLCGGSWSTHASCGPRNTMPGPKRVKTQVRSIASTPSSHFMCKTVPAGGASAACARSRKPVELSRGAREERVAVATNSAVTATTLYRRVPINPRTAYGRPVRSQRSPV